jgi:elongator complex protein 3
MVVEGTELEKWFRDGRYIPYDNDTMTALVASIKAFVPEYVRISRVLRDIPPKFIVGGLKDSLRDVVRERMRLAGTECRCIRCREFGHRTRTGWETGEPKLNRLDYEASDGREVFLSFKDDADTLFGLLRLRLQDHPGVPIAIVRELHVYGPEVPLSGRSDAGVQHRGLGHALLAEAERLARDAFGAAEIAVLSGVGARQYYAEAGYGRRGAYMVKALTPAGRGA